MQPCISTPSSSNFRKLRADSTHHRSQCLSSNSQGIGKFGHGFLSAGTTKALNLNKLMPASNTELDIKRVIAAAAIGGTVSSVTAGKFANGAITAAFAQAYNGNRAEEERVRYADELERAQENALRLITSYYDAINSDHLWLSGTYDSRYAGQPLGMYVFEGDTPWWSSVPEFGGYHFSKKHAGLLAAEGRPWDKGWTFSGSDVSGYQKGALALVVRHPDVSQKFFDSDVLPFYKNVMREIRAPVIMKISIDRKLAITFRLDQNGIHHFPSSADPDF